MYFYCLKKRDPSVKGFTIMSMFNAKQKLLFTDSNNKDFEFWIYDELVRFYYIVEPKPKLKTVSADLRIKDIENNKFPESLKDFKEATTYIRKYFEHIVFI